MSDFGNATQEDRISLTRAVIGLLESWGIGPREAIMILALPEDTTVRNMHRYQMDTPFPDSPDVMERIEHLIGIADALRTTFPRNPQMGPLWMHRRNRHFRRRTPVDLMVEDGLNGVIAVRTHLDCSFAWAASGSTATPCT
ncbi:MAG: DUF2384 domain-containing protein [Gammaproteobacteria bacterium]|jgi:hypothetical protein|nr:DUF2384 domain-containing protein [Gammaproteobacteria bacterium]